MSNTVNNIAKDIMNLTMLSEDNISILISTHLHSMLYEISKDRLSEYEVERLKLLDLLARTKSEDKTKGIRNQLTKLKAKKKKMNDAHRHIDKEMEVIALKKWVRSKYGEDSLNEFFEMSK